MFPELDGGLDAIAEAKPPDAAGAATKRMPIGMQKPTLATRRRRRPTRCADRGWTDRRKYIRDTYMVDR